MEPGSVLNGTYEIIRRISEGGMGEIYQARHVRLGGGYAVKVLRPEIRTRDESAFARFRREAEVTSSLRHPHIVQVIDFNATPEGAPYFVMELLAGQNLADHVAARGVLPLADVVVIVEQAASALQAAHERGIVHRDLKPENIHLEPVAGRKEPYVKVLDFGISKVLAASALTQEFTLVGTPYYMSPEQARGHSDDIDGRTDQFALATIAHELLSGKRAFEAAEVYAILFRVLNDEPTSLVPVAGNAVQSVIARAMRKSRDERYPSVIAFAEALRQAVYGPARESTAFAATSLSPLPFPAPTSGSLSGLAATNATPSPALTAQVAHPARRRWLAALGALLVAGGGTAWFLTAHSGPTWEPGDAGVVAQGRQLRDGLEKLIAEETSRLAEASARAAKVSELSHALAGRVDDTTFQDLLTTEIWWADFRAYGMAVVTKAGVAVVWHLPAKELVPAELLAALPSKPMQGQTRAGLVPTTFGPLLVAVSPLEDTPGAQVLLVKALGRELVTELASRSNMILLLSDGHRALAASVPENTFPEILMLVGQEATGVLVDRKRQRLAAAGPWSGSLWLWGITAWRP